jgi:hypothetical protein
MFRSATLLPHAFFSFFWGKNQQHKTLRSALYLHLSLSDHPIAGLNLQKLWISLNNLPAWRGDIRL